MRDPANCSSAQNDIPLAAVYTALDVKAEIQADDLEPTEKSNLGGPHGSRTTLGGEMWYLERLFERVLREAQEAKREKEQQSIPETDAAYSRRCTAIEAAAAAPRLVLLGAAGSGKSSFGHHLALCLAGETLGRNEANLEHLNGSPPTDSDEGPDWLAWPHGAPLPVFVELRKLVRSPAFDAEPGPGTLLEYLKTEHPQLAEVANQLFAEPRGALVILDGLDETPSAPASRERLKDMIAGFVHSHPQCRVIVTSRPYAYTDGSPWRLEGLGFEEASLAELTSSQAKKFIFGWYRHLAERRQVDAEQAEQRSADLWREIESTRYLKPMAQLPLMLTMMTDLHASSGGRLRGGRAGLYKRSVELLLDRWNEVRDIPEGGTVAEQLGMDVDELQRALERLAFDVHRERGAQGGDQPAEITDTELWKALDRERSSDRIVDERRVMDYLHQRSGILLGESPSVYRFPHRSYQEYLAASYLIRTNFPGLMNEEVTRDPDLWREVVLLAAGQVAEIPLMVWSLMAMLVPESPPQNVTQDDPGFVRALFAALAIQETSLWRRVPTGERRKLDRIRRWLETSLQIGALSPMDRAAGGRVLGMLGDQRPGVGLREDGLPDLDWVQIPAGSFLMGSADTADAYPDEKPQHEVELTAYQISRYPVTHIQFAAFVEDNGYSLRWRDCWTEEGWEWKGDRVGPNDKMEPAFLLNNHPRVNVTWFEASAFCQWLARRSGLETRLPTEAEWEKASRGTGGNIYPWGNDFDASRCNSLEGGIGKPSAVGAFPTGVSPDGVMDMSGNVWEWTHSPWTKDHSAQKADLDSDAVEPADLAEANATPGAMRVIRGGGYWDEAQNARSAYRNSDGPDWAVRSQGFRPPRALRA